MNCGSLSKDVRRGLEVFVSITVVDMNSRDWNRNRDLNRNADELTRSRIHSSAPSIWGRKARFLWRVWCLTWKSEVSGGTKSTTYYCVLRRYLLLSSTISQHRPGHRTAKAENTLNYIKNFFKTNQQFEIYDERRTHSQSIANAFYKPLSLIFIIDRKSD